MTHIIIGVTTHHQWRYDTSSMVLSNIIIGVMTDYQWRSYISSVAL
jgi:hypothetical protein